MVTKGEPEVGPASALNRFVDLLANFRFCHLPPPVPSYPPAPPFAPASAIPVPIPFLVCSLGWACVFIAI